MKEIGSHQGVFSKLLSNQLHNLIQDHASIVERDFREPLHGMGLGCVNVVIPSLPFPLALPFDFGLSLS